MSVSADEKAALCAPLTPAANERPFVVAVRRNGVVAESTVWAESWFDVWTDAVDQHGTTDCRIEVFNKVRT